MGSCPLNRKLIATKWRKFNLFLYAFIYHRRYRTVVFVSFRINMTIDDPMPFLQFLPQSGSVKYSLLLCTNVPYRIILKDVAHCRLHAPVRKVRWPRELALIASSLGCLVAQWNSYGGNWKWVTILIPILVGIVQLFFAICFFIPSYVYHQLHSLDCQNFVHYNSLVFFTYLWTTRGAGFLFLSQEWKGPTILEIV